MAIKNPDLLRDIPLFQLLDDEERAALAAEMDQEHYLKGQLIYEQGDKGGTMSLVQSGRVELFLHDKQGERVPLEVIEPGGLFGELSLLDNRDRSASAKALEETDLLIVDRDDLRLLIKSHPDAAIDIMAILGARLRESNFLIRDRVTRNVNEEIPLAASLGQRLSDFLTDVAGDIRFVYVSVVWFFVWIGLNVHLIPGLKAFDPFPFGLLTMVVSLEAIFLSLFVLISQNRQAAREKIRNDIEYEVNLKAEMEIRELVDQIEAMQQLMLQNFAVIETPKKSHKKAASPDK
jgi:uncharacterized membrane protein